MTPGKRVRGNPAFIRLSEALSGGLDGRLAERITEDLKGRLKQATVPR
jgi:hypothetical protein